VKDNFDNALKLVLQSEGGFVNDAHDPGGATNLGVTKRVWEEWIGHEVDEAAIQRLQPADVAPLYRQRYWDRIKGDDLPLGIDYCCFDFAVNGGPGRAAKILQQAVEVAPDGAIGDDTLAAVNRTSDLVNKFCDLRADYYKSLSNFEYFGKGWLNRVEFSRTKALEMS
jgi:lysozyme family protein